MLLPCKVSRPVPACSTPPLPLIGWAISTASDRAERNRPSTTKSLVETDPLVAPSPTLSTPSSTRVRPVNRLAPVRPKVVAAPRLTRPPAPLITPAKVLDPPDPELRVPAPRSTVLLPALLARLPRVSSPPSTRRVPAASVTAGAASRRLALPSVKVPLLRASSLADALPSSRLAPLLVSTPVPRLATARPASSK